jgi:6-phosphofructokinase 1
MRIGVLTSGGDAPGMNGAIRTVALTGLARGHTILGIRMGYEGLLAGDASPLTPGDIDGIARLGGTILGSARSAVFPTSEGQALARRRIAELGLDALVTIGGNGTLTGAHALAVDRPCQILGIPGSIDNDIGHNGLSIGVDTAVNTIVECCDRISDTAAAHRRAFVVEVMGRRCGFLAMRAGIAAEADAVLYAESDETDEALVARLRAILAHVFSPERKKKRALIVKAEGVTMPTQALVAALAAHLAEDAPGVEIRETVLGHLVRGGRPSALDRMIAQRLGFASLLAAEAGRHDVMLAWDAPGEPGERTPDRQVRIVPIAEVLAETERLLDGSSPVTQRRVALLGTAEKLMSF